MFVVDDDFSSLNFMRNITKRGDQTLSISLRPDVNIHEYVHVSRKPLSSAFNYLGRRNYIFLNTYGVRA